jgi:hypothetical protein
MYDPIDVPDAPLLSGVEMKHLHFLYKDGGRYLELDALAVVIARHPPAMLSRDYWQTVPLFIPLGPG